MEPSSSKDTTANPTNKRCRPVCGERPLPPQVRDRRLAVLVCVLAVLVLLRDPVLFELELRRNIAADVPEQEYVFSATDHGESRLERIVQGFWRSGKIAHRQEVIGMLNMRSILNPDAGLGPYSPIVQEALTDRDSAVREAALLLLVRTEPERAENHLLVQLDDSDIHLRVQAMRALRQLGVTNAMPLIARQLREHDRELVYESTHWLQRMTGVDHLMRSGFVSRQILLSPEVNAVTLKNFRRARASAIAWWETHQGGFHLTRHGHVPPSFKLPEITVDLKRYGLMKSDLKPAEWTSLKGRAVLLYFFASWNHNPVYHLAWSKAVMENGIAVIGVSLDCLPDEHNMVNLEPVFGPPPPGMEKDVFPYPFNDVTELVDLRMRRIGAGFPHVFDIDGRLTRRLQGGELPVFVLLDGKGNLIRRFSGPRSAETFLGTARKAGLIPSQRTVLRSSG